MHHAPPPTAAARSSDRPPRRRLLRHLHFSSGRHYWEALVERMGVQDGVVVGVAPASDASERGSGNFTGPEGEGSVGYYASGKIVRDGECVGRAHPFREGDVVGVLVDMNSLAVGFYLNDRPQTHIPAGWAEDEDANGERADPEERKVGAEGGKSRARLPLRDQAVVAAVSLSSGTDAVVVIPSEPPMDSTS